MNRILEKNSNLFIITAWLLVCFTCENKSSVQFQDSNADTEIVISDSIIFLRRLDSLPETSFRFPVGDSLGRPYAITRPFNFYSPTAGTHLGVDIGDKARSNADLGDTIYSIGDGIVALSYPTNYLSVFYKYKGKIIKVLYFHCDTVFCISGEKIYKNQPVATIGTSNGAYSAHLHLEMMKDTTLWFGGYGDTTGYMDPSEILPFYLKRN